MSISSFSSVPAAAYAERFRYAVTAPLVSVIVPVYNNWEVTERCLASVLSCDAEIAIELIVVDDASTDETPEALARLPGVTVVRNTVNVGFVHGCNRGAAIARGRYLFFLNNDTLLCADSIAALVRRIEADAEIGIVGSKLVYPDGTLQEAGGIIWSDGFAWNYGRSDDVDRPEYNFARDVDYVSGAALLVRAELFRELGAFDERYAPAYYEDADLCFAARAHGMRVVYEPSSVVTHYEGLTAGRDVTAGMKRFYEINRPKFESKWYGVLQREHYVYSEANVRRAARRRGPAKPALLVVGSTISPGTGGSNRLRTLSSAFAAAGHRVVCLPHDLAGAEPWTSRLQNAGIEMLFRSGGDERSWREHLAEALATVDVALIGGPELCRRYLPAIRAQRDIPVLYDASETARSGWDADDLHATCVRAADGTIVGAQVEAEPILEAGFGPVVVVPPASDPELGAARSLIERLAAAPVPPTGGGSMSGESQELERERAAHRTTHRREAQLRLECENAEEASLQHAAESARLHRQRLLDAEERNVVLQHLGSVQSLAHIRTAELTALLAKRQLELAERNLALLRLAAAHELAAAQAAELETLGARRELERQEREALLLQLAQAHESASAHAALSREEQTASAGLRRQQGELEEANRALLEFVAVLQHRCASAESALADVLSSHSWRFTAPARRIMARARPRPDTLREEPAPD